MLKCVTRTGVAHWSLNNTQVVQGILSLLKESERKIVTNKH